MRRRGTDGTDPETALLLGKRARFLGKEGGEYNMWTPLTSRGRTKWAFPLTARVGSGDGVETGGEVRGRARSHGHPTRASATWARVLAARGSRLRCTRGAGTTRFNALSTPAAWHLS